MSVSVVITHKDRPELLKRCIESIRRQAFGTSVEIVVVDDKSDNSNKAMLLGLPYDVLIENDKNMGAPYSRNLGIESAANDIIHLMDCDDYVVNLNYAEVSYEISSNSGIFYIQVKSQGKNTVYPEDMEFDNFIQFITKDYKHICQTSSLLFNKSIMETRFDESLPRHQDWDFVYTELMKGTKARKINGVVFFDRSDTKSISRVRNYEKSVPWLNKLGRDTNFDFIKFYLLGPSTKYYSKVSFFKNVTLNFISSKISFHDALKLIYKRVFS